MSEEAPNQSATKVGENCEKEKKCSMNGVSCKACYKIMHNKTKSTEKKSDKYKSKSYNETKNLRFDSQKAYEKQIENVKRMIRQPRNDLKLTQNELRALYAKYKLDGHYRVDQKLTNEPFNVTKKENCCSNVSMQREYTQNPNSSYYNIGKENRYTQNAMDLYGNPHQVPNHYVNTKVLLPSTIENVHLPDNIYAQSFVNHQTRMFNNGAMINNTMPNYRYPLNINNLQSSDEIKGFSHNSLNPTYPNANYSYNAMENNILYQDCNTNSSNFPQNNIHYPKPHGSQLNSLYQDGFPNTCYNEMVPTWNNNEMTHNTVTNETGLCAMENSEQQGNYNPYTEPHPCQINSENFLYPFTNNRIAGAHDLNGATFNHVTYGQNSTVTMPNATDITSEASSFNSFRTDIME